MGDARVGAVEFHQPPSEFRRLTSRRTQASHRLSQPDGLAFYQDNDRNARSDDAAQATDILARSVQADDQRIALETRPDIGPVRLRRSGKFAATELRNDIRHQRGHRFG